MSKKIHVRPSKGQSKVGFAAGIIFCLIGVCIVIPTFGLFGIFWTAIAGWITYVHYKNGFTNEPIDSHVIHIEDDEENVTVTKHTGYHTYSYDTTSEIENSDIEERLRKLQNLYDQSLISSEEYTQKKKEILKEL